MQVFVVKPAIPPAEGNADMLTTNLTNGNEGRAISQIRV